ncbi:MAG: PAC2 family protein [Halobacteria archaeon]
MASPLAKRSSDPPEDDIEIVETGQVDARGAVLVNAFPAIGMVSTIAARYIVDTVKLPMVGMLRSRYLPPVALVKDHIPHPPARIYAGECGGGRDCRKVVVVVSEFMPAPDLMGTLGERILGWARRKGVETLVTLEGIHLEEAPEVVVFGVGSGPRTRDLLKSNRVELLEEGVVAGLSGVLLLQGAAAEVEVACLLAGTHANYPDARGAASLVEVLGRMLPGLKIDPGPLYQQAEAIEAQLKSALSKARTTVPRLPEPPQPYFG